MKTSSLSHPAARVTANVVQLAQSWHPLRRTLIQPMHVICALSSTRSLSSLNQEQDETESTFPNAFRAVCPSPPPPLLTDQQLTKNGAQNTSILLLRPTEPTRRCSLPRPSTLSSQKCHYRGVYTGIRGCCLYVVLPLRKSESKMELLMWRERYMDHQSHRPGRLLRRPYARPSGETAAYGGECEECGECAIALYI